MKAEQTQKPCPRHVTASLGYRSKLNNSIQKYASGNFRRYALANDIFILLKEQFSLSQASRFARHQLI